MPLIPISLLPDEEQAEITDRFFVLTRKLIGALDRIDQLELDNMVMRGSPMREWAAVPYDDGAERWSAITAEAHAFVDSITP